MTANKPLALISVYDKTGIADFAKGLIELGWEILASAGTAKALTDAGVDVIDVADYTGTQPILGHRVVTLHPKIHGGILANPADATHAADLETQNIRLIDLVVVNLYPFLQDPSEETIDIGGVTLLRAAAKNNSRVGVVASPADYEPVLAELKAGTLSHETRQRLARKAFATASIHDATIINWFDTPTTFPDSIHLVLERAETLKYGENPHQRAARYRIAGLSTAGLDLWDQIVQLDDNPLSYLNLLDTQAGWDLITRLSQVTAAALAVVIKHTNPCGVAAGDSPEHAYKLAIDCDPESAFGGVVAISGTIDDKTADAITKGPPADIVIATDFTDTAIGRLKSHRASTRLLRAPAPAQMPPLNLRQIGNSMLIQDSHATSDPKWPHDQQSFANDKSTPDIEFAWVIATAVTSNAIVMVRDQQAVGIAAGQPNRAEAVRLATHKAAGRAKGGVCASDGFFPFPDGVEAAAEAGIKVIIQPGGSIRDDDVIAKANELNIDMILTGRRQFRH